MRRSANSIGSLYPDLSQEGSDSGILRVATFCKFLRLSRLRRASIICVVAFPKARGASTEKMRSPFYMQT